MAVQLGELLTGLERCLDSLEVDASRQEDVESSSSAKAQVIDCCAVLKLAADHASTSDFIRQDVVKLLHNRLERSSSLADMLLGQHLGAFLQQPQALQLLLTSLPSAVAQQRLLYKSLCHLLQSGLRELPWRDEDVQAESVRMVKERAMWELSKLVSAAPGCVQDSSVVLAGHLPWLLHLLLLTHVGCANAEESSARTTGPRHEASENLSATTVQHFASPGSGWAGTTGQAQRSSPQAAESHSERHESHSISMASNHVSGAEKESPGRIDDGGARQQSPHDRPLISAAAAAIQHLSSGPKLCIWLGLTAEKLDVQQEAEPCLQQSVNVAENARLAAEVAEVCMEAVLQPDQVGSGVLNDLPKSMQGPLHAESLCMVLAAAHMTLLQIAEKAAEQQHRQKGTAGSSMRQHSSEAPAKSLSHEHLQAQTLLRIAAHAKAAMSKCCSASCRTPRTSRSCMGGKAKGISVEGGTHVLKLLEQSLAPAAQMAAVPDAAADLLTNALRHAMGLYRISLAGPSPDVDYGIASSACMDIRLAFQRSRLADFELAAPSSPSAQGLRTLSKGSPGRPASSGGLRDVVHTAKRRRIDPQPLSSACRLPESLPGSAATAQLSTPAHHHWLSKPGSSKREDPCQGTGTSDEGSGSDQESPLLQRGQFTDAQAERWWEHYIAVKLDLVQNVLQDDMADDADAGGATSPICSAPGATPARSQPGSSTAAASSQKHSVKQSMISDTGFRELLWQHLHTASLKLARQAIRMAQRQHTSEAGAVAEFPAAPKPDSNNCTDMMADSRGAYSRGAEELGQVFRHLLPEQEVLSGIRNACLLIDPCCGSNTYNSAIAGAKGAPLEAIPVLLAVRMGRYLSGPGHMPVQGLVPAYLELLEELNSFASGTEEMKSRQIGQGRDKGPRQLLSKLLLAFLDAGDMDFGRVPDDASSAGRLIRLILQGMPSAETFCTASAGAIGLCQGMLGLPSKTPTWGTSVAWGSSLAKVLLALPNKRTTWNSSLARVMHSICFDAAESADVATCVTLLHQLLLHMQQGQQNGASAGPSFSSAETFGMTADAVIAACRGVVCWEGLDVPGLAETLELLLDMAIGVFSRCAESTSALLDALDAGGGASAGAKEHCEIAAFGTWLSESLQCFHEWMDTKMPQQLPTKIKSLEDALVAEWCHTEDGEGLVSIMGLLLQRLEACAPANEECSPACPLQEQVRECFVQAFGKVQSGTTGAIALADQADAAEVSLDEGAETPQHSCGKRQKANKEYKATRSSNPYVLAAMAELASHGGGNLKRNSLPRDGQSMPADISNEDPDEISSNDDSGDDLDDFIVCKPGRNYQALFARQFKYSCTEPRSFLRRCS